MIVEFTKVTFQYALFTTNTHDGVKETIIGTICIHDSKVLVKYDETNLF